MCTYTVHRIFFYFGHALCNYLQSIFRCTSTPDWIHSIYLFCLQAVKRELGGCTCRGLLCTCDFKCTLDRPFVLRKRLETVADQNEKVFGQLEAFQASIGRNRCSFRCQWARCHKRLIFSFSTYYYFKYFQSRMAKSPLPWVWLVFYGHIWAWPGRRLCVIRRDAVPALSRLTFLTRQMRKDIRSSA